jgi:hypothetical protein
MKRLLQVVTPALALGILLSLAIAALPARETEAAAQGVAFQPFAGHDVGTDNGGGLKVSTFYSVSQTDSNQWALLNYPTPNKTTTFAGAETWWVPFYFTYSGAVAKVTKFSGDVRNSAGTVVATSGAYTLNAKSNKQEFYIARAKKAVYPSGDYTAELISGGKVVATTTFRVGTVGPAVTALTISKFYPISQNDNNAWAKLNYAPPGESLTFAANQTWWVPFYIAYSGAVPNTTQYSASVRNSAGVVVATAGPYTLPDANNVQEFFVARTNKVNYVFGDYTATVTSGGKVLATTEFTVGGTTRSTPVMTVSTFYSISQNDFNNWSKLKYATPALATTFTFGKTWWIPLFFAYSGAVAKSTKYSVSVKNSAGKTVGTAGPYTLPYVTNTQELYVQMPKKAQYPIGIYTADLLVGGKVLGTTSFIVGRT